FAVNLNGNGNPEQHTPHSDNAVRDMENNKSHSRIDMHNRRNNPRIENISFNHMDGDNHNNSPQPQFHTAAVNCHQNNGNGGNEHAQNRYQPADKHQCAKQCNGVNSKYMQTNCRQNGVYRRDNKLSTEVFSDDFGKQEN